MAQTAAGHAVHQLLLSIRALLDALRQWSEQRMDETQVSDAYVNFGNNFNTTITEFRALRIDMECVSLLSILSHTRSVRRINKNIAPCIPHTFPRRRGLLPSSTDPPSILEADQPLVTCSKYPMSCVPPSRIVWLRIRHRARWTSTSRP